MKHLAALNQFFWKYRYRFFLGILFIILTNYFRILSPQLTGYVVNNVVHAIEGKNLATLNNHPGQMDKTVQWIVQQLQSQDLKARVFWCGIILLVLAIVSGFFMFLMRQTIIVMSRLIEYEQKNQIYQHYQQLDAGFYKRNSTGDLMNRISEDVSRVRMYTGPAIMYFINLAAVLVFSVFFMLKASPRLTVVALCPLPIMAVAIYFVNVIIDKKSERLQALLSSLTTNAQESYSGIRVIKSFVQERAMLGFFTANSEAYKKNALGLAKVEAIYFPSVALLIGFSTILTIMVGGLDVIHNRPGASVGTIAEFVMYIQMLTFPMSAIGWTASMAQRAAASQKRINEFLNTDTLIKDGPAPLLPNLKGGITLNQVSFVYPNTGIKAINNFQLTVQPGQKIAVVGRTGSGKTTLAQLLLRMYDPQQGQIKLDGVDVRDIGIRHLRNQISYVPQDGFLFSETVYNNIAFGLTSATATQVEIAANQASVHQEILGFSSGYQTLIGERGVTLSGGQKQRISIARALIKAPSILILDDCLSAVDAKTEKAILTHFNEYLHNKTAIIITHRIFSLLQFDQIVVMEEGSIVELGNHQALLEKDGVYAEMYRRQLADQQHGEKKDTEE